MEPIKWKLPNNASSPGQLSYSYGGMSGGCIFSATGSWNSIVRYPTTQPNTLFIKRFIVIGDDYV